MKIRNFSKFLTAKNFFFLYFWANGFRDLSFYFFSDEEITVIEKHITEDIINRNKIIKALDDDEKLVHCDFPKKNFNFISKMLQD